jgi:hypothetical protein
MINISIYQEFYLNSRFNLFKYSNFEIPSPNFAAPSAHILMPLINLKIQDEFNFFLFQAILLIKEKIELKIFLKMKIFTRNSDSMQSYSVILKHFLLILLLH